VAFCFSGIFCCPVTCFTIPDTLPVFLSSDSSLSDFSHSWYSEA
jgi:hypothetical protein